MKSMVLSMKASPNRPMRTKSGMIWFGSFIRIYKNLVYYERTPHLIAFIKVLRYNVMDYEEGGQFFD